MKLPQRILVPQSRIGSRESALCIGAPGPRGHALDVFRWSPVNVPPTPPWVVGTSFLWDGAITSNAWGLFSGHPSDEPNEFGHFELKHPTLHPADDYMLGVNSDVDGPSFISRTNSFPGSFHFQCINDDTRTEAFRISKTGDLVVRGKRPFTGIVPPGRGIIVEGGVIVGHT